MNQTKLESFIEAFINIASGFCISLLVWIFVVIPVWELEITMFDNLVITAIYTVISIVRSYFWRRFFNAGIHKAVKSFVSNCFTFNRKQPTR